MNAKKWVQHISGQGEKWEVEYEHKDIWQVSFVGPVSCYLPKSEFRLCTPPEEWEDVTGECSLVTEAVGGGTGYVWVSHNGLRLYTDTYRLRKVNLYDKDQASMQWAFIVERRKS